MIFVIQKNLPYEAFTEENLEFVESKTTFDYVMALKVQNTPKKFQERFPKTNTELLHILEQMLQLNPCKRPTAEELIKNKYFDPIRQPNCEVITPKKLQFIPDEKSATSRDYEKSSCNDEKKKILLKLIKKEVEKFKQ